jgi:ABC-type sugar transport system ATPase subunit
LIELLHVHKRYGKLLALKDVTVRFPLGKITVVLGPSGAGKTTLLRIVAGLEKPDSGSIMFEGVDVTHVPPWKRNISMVFQSPALLPHMTAFENIAFPLEASGLTQPEIRDRVHEVASLLKITDILDKYPEELSGGQAQRVAIARAISVRPKVLLLDEPFSNLDLSLREKLRVELKNIQRKIGITFIHVTHDQDEALELADKLLILHEGKVADFGDTLRVFEAPHSCESSAVLGHNLIPSTSELRSSLLGAPEVICEGKKYSVIPQHRVIPEKCSEPRCTVTDVLMRRYYLIIIMECGDVTLKSAVPFTYRMKVKTGMKICVKYLPPSQ